MTDQDATSLMDRVQTLAAEHATAFVFIMEVEDQNGNVATIRRRVGSDSIIIGMMELLKHDLLTARFEKEHQE